jgi:hypothetical protein
VLREIALFDERLGPDGLEQLILRHYFAGMHYQASEHLECLGAQRYRFAIAGKKARSNP